VHHRGGGWCYSAKNCAERALTSLGTSTQWNATMDLGGGYFSNSATQNPLMYNWNMVFLVYCDGASFASNATEPVSYGNQTIYYRGALVREAVKKDLVANRGFWNLTDLVVSGSSAGGLATFLHSDWWKDQVNPRAKVVGLPDCGFFLDWPTPIPHRKYWYNLGMQYIFDAMKPVIHPLCATKYPGASRAKCLYAEHVSPFIQTPIFAMQARFDSWQIGGELGTNKTGPVNNYGAQLMTRINANLLNNTKHGAFIDSCFHHTGAYDSIVIDKVDAAVAFQQWYNMNGKSKQRIWFQNSPYPCSKCCNNAPPSIIIA